jgi:hypothetical protein
MAEAETPKVFRSSGREELSFCKCVDMGME